jgi:uncharacterized metal-binding protein
MMSGKPVPACARCAFETKACRSEDGGGPAICPTLVHKAAIGRANEQYATPEVHEFARQATIQEGECYAGRGVDPYVFHPVKTRVEETCEFARKMNFKRIGIAFCSGLQQEALSLTEILETKGFEVVSVICKAGRTPKELLGITDGQKIHLGNFESMCSPIAQAMILNEEKTDFNLLVGLCVGHDSLFLKYADSFSTVLVVKDRVLGHNPAAALYTVHSYHARLKASGPADNHARKGSRGIPFREEQAHVTARRQR